jgi:signal peptidase II
MIDRFSKILVQSKLKLFEYVQVIDGVFYIVNIKNTGAAYGFGSDNALLIIIITSILIAVLMLLFIKVNIVYIRVGLAFVISGGACNLYDRIFLGGVTDFISIKPIEFVFANFNFADMYITFGMIALGIYIIFFDKDIHTRLFQKGCKGEENE